MPKLLEALLATFAVVGGLMAVWSGSLAAEALVKRRTPAKMAHQVNVGLALGFLVGAVPAVVAFMIVVGRP
jgi:hypothetical protein